VLTVMIFNVIIDVIKMQIKHVIILNLIISATTAARDVDARCRASTCVMVRYNCVKMTLKSNLSWLRCMHDVRQRAATCAMWMQRCFTCVWLERQRASTYVC